MEQPLHDFRPFQAANSNPRRFVGVIIVGALHLIVIWALATGLAQSMVAKIPKDFIAEVVPPKQQQVKPPPPPPPELQKPPPPFVPPPEINIQTESANTNSITVQSKVSAPATPAPPAPPAPPKPVEEAVVPSRAVGHTHNCDSFYPAVSQRLNESGKVTVKFEVAADGTISNVAVEKSSGVDRLDQAAVNCVSSHFRNEPATQGGKPIATTSEAIISFVFR